MSEELKYDAFISYRHCELDKYVAETLHQELEAYKLPNNIKKKLKGGKTKIQRVFRDKDELPLTSNLEDPIMKALQNSEFLIVICSPRLKESIWCRKEIETFINMHGRDKVLAVLIEGEPADSFPEELLYAYEAMWNPDGTYYYVKKPMEPLAADFRGSNKKEIKKAMKEEILRLLAPMFSLNYDDLKQRQRERKMRRIVSAVSGVAIASLLLGGYFAMTAMKIKKQNVKIKEQAEIVSMQAATLEEQANILEVQNENLRFEQAKMYAKQSSEFLSNDERENAVLLAYEALTERDGVPMPYTADAQKALTNALHMYDGSNNLEAYGQVEMPGLVEDILVSEDKQYMLVRDNLSNLMLWNLEEREVVKTVTGMTYLSDYGFLTNHDFYYLLEGVVIKVNGDTLEETSFTPSSMMVNNVVSVDSNSSGTKLVARTIDSIYVVNVDSMAEESRIESNINLEDTYIYGQAGDNDVFYTEKNNESEELQFVDLSLVDNQPVFSGTLPPGDITKIIAKDNAVYVLSHSYTLNINGVSYVTAYDKATGDILWQVDNVGHKGDELRYSVSDGIETIMANFGNQVLLLNANTGEIIHNLLFEGKGIYCSITDDGDFLLYDSSGICNLVSSNKENMIINITTMKCTELDILERGDYEFLGVPKGENRVVYYRYMKSADVEIYDGELAECEVYGESNDENLVAFGTENNLLKAAYINSYVEIPDANLTCISYLDNTFEIYRTDSMELLNAYEGYDYGAVNYYGVIGDYYCIDVLATGLLLDENGNICADIQNIMGLTADKNKIVVKGRDDNLNSCFCSIPVYSLQEVLEWGEQFIEKRQLKQ